MAHEKIGNTVDDLEAIKKMLLTRIQKLDDAKTTLEKEVSLVEEKIERLKAGKTE
jgi:phage shock protein A